MKITVINKIFPFISGIATAISFYSEKSAFIVFFSLVPLFISLLHKFSVFKFFIYSMSLYTFSFIWISNITSRITENLILRILLSVFLIFAISFVLSVIMTLPFTTINFLNVSVNAKILILPFIYIFAEWLQGAFHPVAFPWLRLGNIVSCYPIFIQSASAFGTLFISLLILYVNACLSLFIYNIKSHSKYIFAFSVIILLSSELIFGYSRISSTQNYTSKSNVTIVQGNYAKDTKFNSTPDEILEKYISLISNSENTDFIVFPETSMHSDVYNNPLLKKKMYCLCEDNQSIILFGSQYKKDDKCYNACMALFPDEKVDAVYLKKHLVPFGEYTPFGIPSLHFTSTDFSAGYDCNLIQSPKGQIGCVICFESIFPESVLKNTQKGAEAITVLTNDSWLGEKIPLYQHHSHSIMRAVENSRYVLTSTNTGISSVIDPHGKIVSRTQINKADAITSDFYMNSKLSFYSKTGDIIIIPSCIIVIYSSLKLTLKYIRGYFFKKT